MDSKKCILLVDDETDILFILGENFRSNGFEVVTATNYDDGLREYFEKKPNVIITDITMPGKTGMEMVEKIRKTDKRTPIFFLTSMTSVSSALQGFEVGANDYIRKPFSTEEVIARVKAAIRTDGIKFTDRLKFGEYELSSSTRILYHGEEETRLSGMESTILEILIHNLNETVKTSDILNAIGKDDDFFASRSLQVYITKIRKLISKDPKVMIITERKIGYRLVG